MGTERISELLADRAIWGLSEGEDQELERGCFELGLDHDSEALERTAAQVLGALLPAEPMPPALQARLAHAAREQQVLAVPPPAVRSRRWLPWLCLAAACLALGFFLGSPAAAPGLAQRSASLSSLPGTSRLAIQKTADPLAGAVQGELLWHAGRQEGYLRLRGLPQNDAQRQQYQLWIFDATRDAARPVDGGVFDVGPGETLVPIRARLPVREASLFAITLEAAGGVVVSAREHIVATAN